MKLVYTALLNILLSQASPAQEASVGLPVLGYAFDSNRGAIRPLRGIPGAAILGDPIDVGFPLVSAAIAPQQDFALALSDGEPPRIVSLSDGRWSVLSLDNTMPAPDRIVFSPSGTAAILLSNLGSGRLQVLSGLPRPPAVEEIDISGLTGPLGNIAVTDDGKLIILADANRNSVWLLNPDRRQVLLPVSGAGLLFSFRRQSHAAAAVSSTGDFYLMQNLDDSTLMRSVAPGSDQTAGAIGLWFADDGSRAFSVSAAGSVTAVDLTTGATQSVACQCVPTGIQPLRRGMFRLTGISSRPVMILDVSTPKSRVWFVPPDLPEARSAGGGQ